jgi:SEC-C motif-containing protein
MISSAPCPCAKAGIKLVQPYSDCCGRWLDTATPAPDAQALMRSRYTAFVLERAAYLLATWHTSQRPPGIQFEPGVKWLGLDVRSFRSTGATTAEVEFVARQKPARTAAVRLHERSRFVLEDGHWFYVDGDAL